MLLQLLAAGALTFECLLAKRGGGNGAELEVEVETATGELWHKLKFKQTRRRGGKSRLPHPHNLRISLSLFFGSSLSPRLSLFPCAPFHLAGFCLFCGERSPGRRRRGSAVAAKTRGITTTKEGESERGELNK